MRLHGRIKSWEGQDRAERSYLGETGQGRTELLVWVGQDLATKLDHNLGGTGPGRGGAGLCTVGRAGQGRAGRVVLSMWKGG